MGLELEKADTQEVGIYAPYYREPNRKSALPYAISLYKRGELEGIRPIEGGPAVTFVATWRVSTLPSDISLCRVTFDGDADMTYEVALENSEFVGYLIDVVIGMRDNPEDKKPDFPQGFYSKLFRIKLGASDGF